MKPANADQMTTLMVVSALTRAYGDVTEAARRGRLTEHDIATIERRILGIVRSAPDVSGEFTTFETEPAMRNAEAQIREMFARIRTARVDKITDK